MRSSIQDKWLRLMDNSRLTDMVQEIIPKAGSVFIVKLEERGITRVINQLLTGHSNFNYMIAKIDNAKSELCDTCKVKETVSHYNYDFKIYEEDRKGMEKDVGRILAAYGLQHIQEINLKLKTGNFEEAIRVANLDLRSSSHGQAYSQNVKYKIFHIISIYNLLEGLFYKVNVH